MRIRALVLTLELGTLGILGVLCVRHQ